MSIERVKAQRPELAQEEIAISRAVTVRRRYTRWHEDMPLDISSDIMRIYNFQVRAVSIRIARLHAQEHGRLAQYYLLNGWLAWMFSEGIEVLEFTTLAKNRGVAFLSVMARFGAKHPTELPIIECHESAMTAHGTINGGGQR